MSNNSSPKYDLPGIPESMLKLRKLFLELISELKPEVIRDLRRLFNFDSIPGSWKEMPDKIELCRKFFLCHSQDYNLYSEDLTKLGFLPDVRNTPFLNLFDFIHRNQREFNRLFKENLDRIVDPGVRPSVNDIGCCRWYSMITLIPKWSKSKSRGNLKLLCRSITDWGEKWNLGYEWVFEIALRYLKFCKVNYVDELQIPKSYLKLENGLLIEYERLLDEEFNLTVLEFNDEREYFNPKLNNLPPFKYKLFLCDKHEIETYVGGDRFIYDPIFSSRDNFRLWCERIFWEELITHYGKDYHFRHLASISDQVLKEYKNFQNAIEKYIKEVETLIEPFVVKAPIKKDDTHFRWLIEFQIPEVKSFATIARENNVSEKTVRDGIKSAADLIGIELREARPTGRPRGIKETKKRVNYRYW